MPIHLEQVVPWGRSFDEYVRMFGLGDSDLDRVIFDCAGGPASFNCEMRRRGCRVVSADPIYRFSAAQLAQRFGETRDTILSKTAESRENFVWDEMQSISRLGEIRMQAMNLFLRDFPGGLAEGRYLTAELPQLPFGDSTFDLALCSHFLFTYSDLLSLEFHVESIRELCRVAGEARIFPLVPHFADARSPHLPPLINHLTADGYFCEIIRVPYEFQRGANEMLRATRSVQ
ncbi:MAG: SAM-dependent methyltransferase [Acidobacteriota bacterium]|nr:SAM-dependent methyltransferase [Acidobacteriota bacterium]